MTPEGRVKEAVKALLRKYRVYWHMPVQNGMGAPSLDFICCVNGKYLAIETKAPGAKPTLRQNLTIERILQAGGTVFVVDGELRHVETWIQLTQLPGAQHAVQESGATQVDVRKQAGNGKGVGGSNAQGKTP